MADTIGRIEHESRLLHRAGALDFAFAVALTCSSAVVGWSVWSLTNPMIRTVARIVVLYLGNDRG